MSDKEKLEIAIRALRFYERPENWGPDRWGIESVIVPEYGTPGRRARNALKRIRAAQAEETP